MKDFNNFGSPLTEPERIALNLDVPNTLPFSGAPVSAVLGTAGTATYSQDEADLIDLTGRLLTSQALTLYVTTPQVIEEGVSQVAIISETPSVSFHYTAALDEIGDVVSTVSELIAAINTNSTLFSAELHAGADGDAVLTAGSISVEGTSATPGTPAALGRLAIDTENSLVFIAVKSDQTGSDPDTWSNLATLLGVGA